MMSKRKSLGPCRSRSYAVQVQCSAVQERDVTIVAEIHFNDNCEDNDNSSAFNNNNTLTDGHPPRRQDRLGSLLPSVSVKQGASVPAYCSRFGAEKNCWLLTRY